MDLTTLWRLFPANLLSIVLEALPFILVGSLVSGFVEEFLSGSQLARLVPRRLLPALLVSAVLPLALPMCECGIIPVIRRLVRKGLPVGCAVTYMLAGPIINPIVMASTYAAFTGTVGLPAWLMLACRVAVALVVAVLVGLLFSRFPVGEVLLHHVASTGPDAVPEPGAPRAARLERLRRAVVAASQDFFEIGVYLIIGGALAAAVNSTPAAVQMMTQMGEQTEGSALGMMVLAALLNLCSEADAFVAASFTQVNATAKLAFLVFGPMFDLKLLVMYHGLYRPKAIWQLVSSVTALVFFTTMLVHWLGVM